MPYLSLAVSTLAVSSASIFVRFASEVDPLAIAFYRLFLSSLVLGAFALRERDSLGRMVPLLPKVALSGLFLALHFATWISSLFYTTVSSSLLLVNTHPIWVCLLSPFLLGERVGRKALLGMGLALLGSLALGFGDWAVGGRALFGDLLALVGGLTVALYMLMGRDLRRSLPLSVYASSCYGFAALICLGFAALFGVRMWGYSPFSWLMILALVAFPQMMGHTLYNYSLRFFKPHVVSVCLLGEPVFGSALAYLALGEPLGVEKLPAFTAVLVGLYLVSSDRA